MELKIGSCHRRVQLNGRAYLIKILASADIRKIECGSSLIPIIIKEDFGDMGICYFEVSRGNFHSVGLVA